jgi:hypothetical protein
MIAERLSCNTTRDIIAEGLFFITAIPVQAKFVESLF